MARHCTECRSSLAPACLQCGNGLRADARFCDRCGAPVASRSGPDTVRGPAESPPILTLGDGRYLIRQFLGDGASKRVFRAFDTRLSREVAVSLLAATLDDPDELEREAQLVATLCKHPHIVVVHDIDRDPRGRPFVVAEILEGGDLESRLQSAPAGHLALTEAVRIAHQVAAALAHAHSVGVVHRDVKPANVWLTADGTAKLGDFGVAHVESASSERGFAGTPAYMAPEVLLGAEPSSASDVYSLGAVLYRCLTGSQPFGDVTNAGPLDRDARPQPPSTRAKRHDIPPRLDKLLTTLVAPTPDDRPAASQAEQELRALQTSIASGRAASGPIGTSALIGRTRELETLTGSLDRLYDSLGASVTVVGEAGIGKSTLADAFTQAAIDRGFTVAFARCRDVDGVPALWPWSQIVRTLLDQRPECADVIVSHEILDLLIAGAGEADKFGSLEPEALRFRLFEGLVALLGAATETEPAVVVLDDLHWADSASLHLLRLLAPDVSRLRVLLVVTTRDVDPDPDHPLEGVIAGIASTPRSSQIELGGLGHDDVGEIIHQITGRRSPEELVSAISDRTDGNPFFVSQVAHLLDSGNTEQAAADVDWITHIPRGLADTISRRLAPLPSSCQDLIDAACVIGREFRLDVLAATVGASFADTVAALEPAILTRIVEEMPTSPGSVRFAHALVRDALYEELPQARRHELHAKVAAAYESVSTDDLQSLFEIAHHLAEAFPASDANETIERLERAARASAQAASYEDAAQFLSDAYRIHKAKYPAVSAESGQLALRLGQHQWRAQQPVAAKATLSEAMQTADAIDDAKLHAEAALAYAGQWVDLWRVDDDVTNVLEAALHRLPTDEPVLEAELTGRLAQELHYALESPDRRVALADVAVAIARSTDDPVALGQTLLNWHIACWSDNVEDRLAVSSEMLDAAEASGVDLIALHGWHFKLTAHLELGDIPATIDAIHRYDELARKIRLPHYVCLSPFLRAMIPMLTGDVDAAYELIAEGRAYAERFDVTMGRRFDISERIFFAWELGHAAELESHVRGLVAEFPGFVGWQCFDLSLDAMLGDVDRARARLSDFAADDFARIPVNRNWLLLRSLLVDTATSLEMAEACAGLYPLVAPFEGYFVATGPGLGMRGSAARFAGMCATVLERWDDAERHFEKALADEERHGLVPYIAQTKWQYAEMLTRRNRPADADRAAALRAAALAAFERIGMLAPMGPGYDTATRLRRA